MFNKLFNCIFTSPEAEYYNQAVEIILDLIYEAGAIDYLLYFLMNLCDIRLSDDNRAKLHDLLIEMKLLVKEMMIMSMDEEEELFNANCQLEFLRIINKLELGNWHVLDLHPHYLSVLLSYIQKLNENITEENIEMMVILYDLLNKELNYLYSYDLSKIGFNYSEININLVKTVYVTMEKYNAWISGGGNEEKVKNIKIPEILYNYCDNILSNFPTGSKLEMLINVSKYNNYLSNKIAEKFRKLLTDPKEMSKLEKDIFDPKIKMLYLDTLNTLSSSIVNHHKSCLGELIIQYILESTVFQVVRDIKAENKKENNQFQKVKNEMQIVLEIIDSILISVRVYVKNAITANCVDEGYSFLYQVLPLNLFSILLILTKISSIDELLFPFISAISSDLIALRNSIYVMMNKNPNVQNGCLYDYISYICGYCASQLTKSLTVSQEEQELSVWLNSSLFYDGLMSEYDIEAPYNMNYDVIGLIQHVIDNNGRIVFPEFYDNNSNTNSASSIEYIRNADMVLIFINNYICKYGYEEFNRIINVETLDKLELNGLKLADQSFFYESLPSLQNRKILQFLVSSFNQDKYISKLSIDKSMCDDSFIQIVNKPKVDVMTNRLSCLLSKSKDKSMTFIVNAVTSLNGIIAPQLILNNKEMYDAIIQCFCCLSYLYGKSLEIVKMVIVFNENEKTEFDYEPIRPVIISLCRVIQHLREMKQFYNRNEENSNSQMEIENDIIDSSLPFNDYLKKLEKRCVLIQQCELYNSNNEKDGIESNVKVALSYICNADSINNEKMIELLKRREIRSRIRMSGLRMYSLLLKNEGSNELILNGFLSSLCGKYEGFKLTAYGERNSYRHYTKDISGCSIKSYYELCNEFYHFLISFKESMMNCFNKEYYKDLLSIKEIYLDYRECDLWMLEKSNIIDMFNQITKFNKVFVIEDIKMIEEEKCFKHYHPSIYDAISSGYFNKSELLLELSSMNLCDLFWKSHGIEPGLEMHLYVKCLSEENMRVLAYHAIREMGVISDKDRCIRKNRKVEQEKNRNTMEIEEGKDNENENDDENKEDDGDEMEVEDENYLDVDDDIGTTNYHRNIHNDILGTCLIDDLCNNTVVFILSSILKDGESKKRSYEKKYEKNFEELFKKNSKEDIPKYQPMVFKSPKGAKQSSSNPFLQSLFSYIDGKLENINQFFQNYKVLSYDEEKKILLSLIESKKQQNEIEIDLDQFSEDESIINKKLFLILSKFERIGIVCSANEISSLVEIYERTTIPNQILILKSIRTSLMKLSTDDSSDLNKIVVEFIVKLLLEVGRISLYGDVITFKTDEDLKSIKPSSNWRCLVCDVDNKKDELICEECEMPYSKAGIIIPSHDNCYNSFSNFNGDNLMWKRTELTLFIKDMLNNNNRLFVSLFNSCNDSIEKVIGSLKSSSLKVNEDFFITAGILSIHNGIESIISKGSIVEANINGIVSKCRIIEINDCYSKLKVEVELSKKVCEVDYDSVTSMNIQSIPLNKSPYSSLLCNLIQAVYEMNENNILKLIPGKIKIISLLAFNYLKSEVFNNYDSIPADLLPNIIKSIINISITVSDLPFPFSPLQLSHLLTFNSSMFYSMNYLYIKSFVAEEKKVIEEYTEGQSRLIENIIKLGASKEQALFTLKTCKWNEEFAKDLFTSGVIDEMMKEKQGDKKNVSIEENLSETTGTSIELSRKAIELYKDINEAANWLIENSERYSKYSEELFKGELTYDILTKQQIDYSLLNEENKSNDREDTIANYCSFSKYDNNYYKALKIGQIVFVDMKQSSSDPKKQFAVFLYGYEHINYFVTIKNHQSTIICINDDKMKDSVYLLDDKYGYDINNVSNCIENIKAIANTLCIISNRDILMKLMIIKPEIYFIKDPYSLLQYYKRICSGNTLNTELLSNIVENKNVESQFEIMTKMFVNKLQSDKFNEKVMLESELSPCESNNHQLSSIITLSLSEMLWHFSNSENSSKIANYEVIESLHPLYKPSKYIGKVSLSNCKSMIIVFDEKCEIGTGSLVFSLDEKCRNVFRSFGEDTQLQSFAVNANTVYYSLGYGSSNRRWGYRFFVIGLRECEVLCEKNLLSPNVEWSLWLLNIILHQPNLIDSLDKTTKQEFFNSLIKQFKVSQNKERIIRVLISLFRDERFIESIPHSNEIDSLAKQAYDNINKNCSNNIDRFLVELYCASELHSNTLDCNHILDEHLRFNNISCIYYMVQSLNKNEIPIEIIEYAILKECYTKRYESSHPMIETNIMKYDYKSDHFNKVTVIICKNTDVGNGNIKIEAENYKLNSNTGRFDYPKRIIYENVKNVVATVTPPNSDTHNEYGVIMIISPNGELSDFNVLKRVGEENGELIDKVKNSMNNIEIIKNVMKIRNEYDGEIWSSEQLLYVYSDYIDKNGIDNVPEYEIFKLIVDIIELIGFNVISVLKYVDLSQVNVKGSFANLLQNCKMFISKREKKSYLNNLLDGLKNSRESQKDITIDRFKANDEKEKGITDSLESNCVFKQVYNQLFNFGEKIWFASGGNRVFEVYYRNEAAQDAGGPYRECLNEMIEDLFSEHFDLFIPTSNNKHKFGIDVDCYVPNPNCKGNEHLKMYEFVGRIMGYSILSNSTLPFMFPECLWKVISGEELRYEDIISIDQYSYQNLEAIKNAKKEEDLPKLQAFVITNEFGETTNLKPGTDEELSLDNRNEHYELVVNYFFHRFDIQIKAILKGLYNIIPQSTFFLCDGKDVEELVCGKQEIDLEYLKQNTRYNGYEGNEKTIIDFWKVMESFSHEERRKFIRFVWGRSRLPPEGVSWGNCFQIARNGATNSLPSAATCSFRINLPDYEDYDKLAEKLRIVINYGLGSMLNN